jgi:hypothetical protein
MCLIFLHLWVFNKIRNEVAILINLSYILVIIGILFCNFKISNNKPNFKFPHKMSFISFYFNQILTAINKLKIMSEVVLLLLNTDLLQQVEDYLRGCTTTKYWPPSESWRLCQRLYYLYQILTSFNKLKIISEVVLLILNTDLLQQVEDCQRLYYFYQILTSFNKLTIMSEFAHVNCKRLKLFTCFLD